MFVPEYDVEIERRSRKSEKYGGAIKKRETKTSSTVSTLVPADRYCLEQKQDKRLVARTAAFTVGCAACTAGCTISAKPIAQPSKMEKKKDCFRRLKDIRTIGPEKRNDSCLAEG